MTDLPQIVTRAFECHNIPPQYHDTLRVALLKTAQKSPTYHEIPKQLDQEQMTTIRDDVLAELTDTPQSVREIAEASGHSYSRTRHALDALVKTGKAVKTKVNRRVFFMGAK